MTCHGSPTALKMVDVGKAAAFEGIGTTATDHNPIEAARPTGEEDAIPGGLESRAGGMDQSVLTEGITLAFGQRLKAIVHSMEDIDNGHRFRLAYLRKHWGTQTHHGDTFALDVVRERYFRLGTENLGSPEFSELLELHKDRVYDDANIASAAKSTARQRFGGALWRTDRDWDGGGGSRENFKITRPVREAVAQ
eukprot:jgi/Tetstr1/444369/TSEL_032260.t1